VQIASVTSHLVGVRFGGVNCSSDQPINEPTAFEEEHGHSSGLGGERARTEATRRRLPNRRPDHPQPARDSTVTPRSP